jgi:hypothetical protein
LLWLSVICPVIGKLLACRLAIGVLPECSISGFDLFFISSVAFALSQREVCAINRPCRPGMVVGPVGGRGETPQSV